MEGHICRQNTLTFALVFCFELRAHAARTCCHCHLAVKNLIHDGNQSVKSAKKSQTVPQCGHVTLNCVQMASKQAKVEFSLHIFQFTRLHGVAVMQGLTFWDSVVTLYKSARWYVLSGTGFLVAHQLLEMWCANAKLANQVPTSHVKTLVIRMSWSYRRCFEWQER